LPNPNLDPTSGFIARLKVTNTGYLRAEDLEATIESPATTLRKGHEVPTNIRLRWANSWPSRPSQWIQTQTPERVSPVLQGISPGSHTFIDLGLVFEPGNPYAKHLGIRIEPAFQLLSEWLPGRNFVLTPGQNGTTQAYRFKLVITAANCVPVEKWILITIREFTHQIRGSGFAGIGAPAIFGKNGCVEIEVDNQPLW